MQVYQNRLSWGALLFDMDNDGYKDIYVCNGIYHDLQIKILLISSRMNLCKNGGFWQERTNRNDH
jgi:hypothetical protein